MKQGMSEIVGRAHMEI